MANTVLTEVIRRMKSEGAFESWSRRPKEKRLAEDSSAFRASTALRDAQDALFEMNKFVSASWDTVESLPLTSKVLRSMATALAEIGEGEAAGALDEVAVYIDEIQYGGEYGAEAE